MGAGKTGNMVESAREVCTSVRVGGKNPKSVWWNAKGGNVESCSRVKDGNGRLGQGEDEARKIWKENFEDLHNIYTQEEVVVHMCGFNRVRRSNYFGGEPIERAEVEVRGGKLKNGKAAG